MNIIYNMQLRDIPYMFGYTRIVKVDDKLLRGNAIFMPTKIARLKAKNVTQVIDLRDDGKAGSPFLKRLEKFYCKLFNIKYVEAKLQFVQNRIPNEDYFSKVIKLIQNNDGKSYVHCRYGKHRTGFVVAMYEKSKNICNDKILRDLFNYGWNKKSDFEGKRYKGILAFIKKFFPSQKNLQLVEIKINKFV